jgi:hypothetical protein
MTLSNAERQKRFRENLKQKAQKGDHLTPDEIADRDAVMADPIYPVPGIGLRDQLPTFMGWNRYEWSVASEALIDHFGMREAWDGWRAEKEKIQRQIHEQNVRADAHYKAVIADLIPAAQERATQMIGREGQHGVLAEIVKDASLGTKRKRNVT